LFIKYMVLNLFKLFSFGSGWGRSSVSSASEARIRDDWKKINAAIASKSPAQLRQALIMADRSLDAALKDISDGESMGERLKSAENRFDRYLYSNIWGAHKIRNNLVHEAGFEPPHFILTENITVFKEALRALGVII